MVHYHCPECDALHREGLPESWILEGNLVFVKKKDDVEVHNANQLGNDFGSYQIHVKSHPCVSVQDRMIGLGEDETAEGVLSALSGMLKRSGVEEPFHECSVSMRCHEAPRSDILVHDSAGNMLFVLSYHSD